MKSFWYQKHWVLNVSNNTETILECAPNDIFKRIINGEYLENLLFFTSIDNKSVYFVFLEFIIIL